MIPSVTHQEVNDPEVLLQAVTHEANARVDEEAQLQVGRLQGRQMLRGDLCIQVSWFDAGVLSQVVDHLQEHTFTSVVKTHICILSMEFYIYLYFSLFYYLVYPLKCTYFILLTLINVFSDRILSFYRLFYIFLSLLLFILPVEFP